MLTPVRKNLVVVMASGLLHCAGGQSGSAPPAPTSIATVERPAASAPPAPPLLIEGPSPPAATADGGTPPVTTCEGPKHLSTPAAGVGNDKAFTVAAAIVRSHSRSDYATIEFVLGSHTDRFKQPGRFAEWTSTCKRTRA